LLWGRARWWRGRQVYPQRPLSCHHAAAGKGAGAILNNTCQHVGFTRMHTQCVKDDAHPRVTRRRHWLPGLLRRKTRPCTRGHDARGEPEPIPTCLAEAYLIRARGPRRRRNACLEDRRAAWRAVELLLRHPCGAATRRAPCRRVLARAATCQAVNIAANLPAREGLRIMAVPPQSQLHQGLRCRLFAGAGRLLPLRLPAGWRRERLRAPLPAGDASCSPALLEFVPPASGVLRAPTPASLCNLNTASASLGGARELVPSSPPPLPTDAVGCCEQGAPPSQAGARSAWLVGCLAAAAAIPCAGASQAAPRCHAGGGAVPRHCSKGTPGAPAGACASPILLPVPGNVLRRC
jgi:hypothetical protein